MKGRKALAYESEWLVLCKQIPCLACSLFHGEHDTPAEIHHTQGQTKKDAHLLVISLCVNHHRIKDNQHPKRWISFHGDGRQLFEDRYMPIGAFLKEQKQRVLLLQAQTV